MLSPLLYSLLTHDCVATHVSKSIIKFVDDTIVVDLITNNNETAFREEMRALAERCQENNLSLNVNKQELNVDYRRQQRAHPHRRAVVEFLGVHITDNLKWSLDTVCRRCHITSSTSGG